MPSCHDLGVDAGDFLDDVLELEIRPQRLFLGEQPFDRGIVEHAFGIAQRPHHQPRIELGGVEDRLLHIFMHRRFLRRDEARAHVDAIGAQRQRRDELLAIGHPARGDEGNLQFLGGARQQDQVRHIVFAGVAAAFEAIDRHGIATDRFRPSGCGARWCICG